MGAGDSALSKSPIAAILWLLAGTARADDPCLAVHAIDGLTPAEQQTLGAACRASTPSTVGLAPLLGRITARGDWASTSLADLLAGGAPTVDVGAPDVASNRLRLVRDALAQLHSQPACKPLQEALDSYFKARDGGDRTTPPFTEVSLAGCPGFLGDELADLALLTIAADDPTAELFVAASAGERTVLQWFAPADAFIHQGRRVFVVAVPRWSVVSVRATGAPAPQRWHGFVANHQTVWNDPPTTSCLRMSVDLDPDMTLLLDGRSLTAGRPLVHQTVSVRAGAHSLVALQCKPGAPADCTVRYREVLAPIDASARDNLCRDVALDLHQRRSVAVLLARAAPGCDAALAWRAGELAREHLRLNQDALGRSFRDLASYASITEALGHLRDGLNPGAGQAVGAATGADSLDQIASVAKEAWRQGIDELVTLELRCDASGLDLKATAISARELFERQLGPVAGADLKDLLRIQTLGFADEQQLPSTIASLLEMLFDRSLLRFREGPDQFNYHRRAHLGVVSRSPGGLKALARRVSTPSGGWPVGHGPREQCESMRDRIRHAGLQVSHLATRATHASALRSRLDPPARVEVLPVGAQPGDTRSEQPQDTADPGPDLPDDQFSLYDLKIRARRPGVYLVAASDSRGAPVDTRCISFAVPARELWGSAMFSPDIAFRTPITELIARHTRVMFGHTWYFQRRPWLGLGVVGGYTYTRNKSRTGVPAWQDLTAQLDPPATRTDALTWGRHAIVAGPLLEFRSRRGDLPFEFRGRLSAGFGVALIDVRKLASFADFSGSAYFGTTDVRARPTIDATVELGVGAVLGPLSITPLLTLGAVGLNDMPAGRWAVSALNGAAMYFGVGLHLGGAR